MSEHKHTLRVVALAACAAALPIWPQAPAPPNFLALSSRFDLTARMAKLGMGTMNFGKMVAARRHLYFLATPNPTLDNAVLVRSDLKGNVEWSVHLGTSEAVDLTVDVSGNAWVLSLPDSGPADLRAFDPFGRPVGAPVGPVGFRVVTAGRHVYSVTPKGTVRDHSGGRTQFDSGADLAEHEQEVKAVPLDDNLIALVDGVRVEMDLVDASKGGRTHIALTNPDALRAKAYYAAGAAARGAAYGTTIIAAAAWRGTVYCMLSNFDPKDGIPILAVEPRTGAETLLRAASRLDKNAQPTLPMAMAADDGTLFIVDNRGVVSAFRLTRTGMPNQN